MSAERAEITDFQFNPDETYSPSNFRAQAEMLAQFSVISQATRDKLRKNAEWAGKFSDEDTIIKWIQEEGMIIPVAASFFDRRLS